MVPEKIAAIANFLLIISSSDSRRLRSPGARRRNRTVTPLSGPGILSPVRLPVSPSGLPSKDVTTRNCRGSTGAAIGRMLDFAQIQDRMRFDEQSGGWQ